MNYKKVAMQKHAIWKGKFEIKSRVPLNTKDDLSIAYTPGVAEPCLAIQKDINLSYEYTRRANLVAVITDGSAVLGLGNIGPEAGMPVMEGKAVLFKEFADVDAFPLCISSQNVDTIVETIVNIAGSFGGINLEDISAPRCFEIEKRLIERLDIPVFHDDQHGTAVVVLAALINALKLTKRKFEDVSVVINGCGSAGVAIAKLIHFYGIRKLMLVDRQGIVSSTCKNDLSIKDDILKISNHEDINGNLSDALKGADIFIGVSAPNIVTQEMVRSMAPDPMILAMANPEPEISPNLAKEAGARIVGTGRSDFANQVNNVLGFPGIFRGALDVRASAISNSMKIAAAQALANCVKPEELNENFIIPSPLNRSVAPKVAAAVAQAARDEGLARI